MEHGPNYVPSHTRSGIIYPIFRYAVVMLIASLITGVLSRELSRPLFRDMPLSAQWVAGHYLNQLHGHVLTIGFVLPLGLALMTYVLRPSLIRSDVKQLRTVFSVIVVSSLATLLLLLYKGVATAMMMGKEPTLSLDQIDQQLFYGNAALRTALHTLAHTALGISTTWYALKLHGSLSFINNEPRQHQTER